MPQTISKLSDDPLGAAVGSSRLRIHEVESWIETLPLANVGEAYHRVLGALLKLNDSALPGQERFEALELFRRPIHYLSDALNHHFVGTSFPLPLRSRGIAAQLYDLHAEMARGYQGISGELLDLNTLRQDFMRLATSMHRSLYYLGQGLLTSYQVYESCSADCWRRIHRIYEAAERKGVQSSVVKDPYRRNKQETSVEEQYKQILLLALANPFRYSQADMVWIYTLLEHWTSQCRFHPANHFDELQYACLVDLASDEAPSYIAYSAVPHPQTCRLLDTSALIQSLLNSFPRSPDEFPKQASGSGAAQTTILWRDLLHALIAAWGLTTKRRFSRMQPKTTTVGINLGLSTIHQLIDNMDSRPANEAVGIDERPAAPNMRKTASTGRSTAVHGNTYLCEVINESADGSRLKWHNANKGRIRVGELIAIRHAQESGETPGIAVIRWLKNTSRHTVEFGIQLLSPDAISISIRLYHAKDQEPDQDYLQGLYIPEFKPTRQPASLILPAFLYHADDIVSLIMDHQEHCLRLVKAIETTQGFSRFHFASMAIAQDDGRH